MLVRDRAALAVTRHRGLALRAAQQREAAARRRRARPRLGRGWVLGMRAAELQDKIADDAMKVQTFVEAGRDEVEKVRGGAGDAREEDLLRAISMSTYPHSF